MHCPISTQVAPFISQGIAMTYSSSVACIVSFSTRNFLTGDRRYSERRLVGGSGDAIYRCHYCSDLDSMLWLLLLLLI